MCSWSDRWPSLKFNSLGKLLAKLRSFRRVPEFAWSFLVYDLPTAASCACLAIESRNVWLQPPKIQEIFVIQSLMFQASCHFLKHVSKLWKICSKGRPIISLKAFHELEPKDHRRWTWSPKQGKNHKKIQPFLALFILFPAFSSLC